MKPEACVAAEASCHTSTHSWHRQIFQCMRSPHCVHRKGPLTSTAPAVTLMARALAPGSAASQGGGSASRVGASALIAQVTRWLLGDLQLHSMGNGSSSSGSRGGLPGPTHCWRRSERAHWRCS